MSLKVGTAASVIESAIQTLPSSSRNTVPRTRSGWLRSPSSASARGTPGPSTTAPSANVNVPEGTGSPGFSLGSSEGGATDGGASDGASEGAAGVLGDGSTDPDGDAAVPHATNRIATAVRIIADRML